MKIAATGVTSGVGRRLCEIAREAGHEVTGLVRDPERLDARALSRIGVRIVGGDIADRPALADVLRGADVVVHAAAMVGEPTDAAEMERVNVGGTRAVIEAAAEARVPHVVHVSSVAVYGRPDRGRVTEAWPTRTSGLPYEDTKTHAERLAHERGRALGLSVIAVRPPMIYGPHDRNFLPRALATLRKRMMLLVDGGRTPLNVVWVDHVVDVVLRAAERRDLGGEAFNVMDEVDARPPSVREVFEAIARAAELPAPRLSLPYPAAMAAAKSLAAVFSLAGRKETPPLTPFVVKLLSRDVVYDASKAVRELGWTPRMRALEGISRYAAELAGKAPAYQQASRAASPGSAVE
ncbi:NAD-dependent epimerase/dehydratase family protein [Polyangium sp. 15x6]|uniref:NAD-dependent epimerase/dehydratase family protein n=1 Tax=Polyangium sp. 15x6 TaxID=3042687 RepID=UPI00249B2388|nr:NAD-dependent epimerase/dehydratase family protein [Polyangium sp. 15x6]MDI3290338.1 NAD-dependent epimerase/dehydratase family protein [Polyangium sp. 15x6]